VADRALGLIAGGASVSEATAQVHRESGGKTAGCNPAHRSAPLSMLADLSDDQLADAAMAEARLTHRDPVAGEVAAAVNVLCRSLIREVPWQDAVGAIDDLVDLEEPYRNGGHAPDVLRAALHFVGTSGSFAEALERALAFAGPSNYCPVLVGSIGGARWGASAIPRVALEHVELLRMVRAVARALSASWPRES
jgi:ADP-ribosylglycohydrolase